MQIVTLASKMSYTSSYFDYIYQLTAASELVRGQAVDSFVLEMLRFVTSGTTVGQSPPPQPVCEPGHVAVAVEGVGDEVEGGERGQLVEGSRRHTTDLVPKQAQALQVVQALWKIFV